MKRTIFGLGLTLLVTLSMLSLATATMTGKAMQMPTIVMPDDLKWTPANGLTGVQMAVVLGDPSKPGPYIMRLKLDDGATIPPHWHPGDERVTVLSGTFMVGIGDTVDPSKMKALGAGSFVFIPEGLHHYAMAKGETIVQASGTGPFAMNFVK